MINYHAFISADEPQPKEVIRRFRRVTQIVFESIPTSWNNGLFIIALIPRH